MKFCYWLFVVGLLWSGRLSAQPFTIHNLGLQQGLPEYYVSGLVQDKAGFIWVATRDGLARYDGRQFKVFRKQPFNPHSLASNVILSLQTVSDTTLLIQFENWHIQLFNPFTERFTDLTIPKPLEKSPRTILTGQEDQLWGRLPYQLVGFNRKTKQLQSHPFPQSARTTIYFSQKSLLQTTQQHLFAVTTGHLLEFVPQTGQFQDWPHPGLGQVNKTLETYYDTHLIQRSNGEIIITGLQQLIFFNPKTHQFRSIPIPGSIHVHAGLIYEAADKNIYFTYGMTVYRLTTDDHIQPIWTASRIDYRNYFHALLLDRSGVLWIGTNGDGIYQIDLSALPIKTYPQKTSFIQDVLTTELGVSVPDWAKTNRYDYGLRWGGRAPYVSIGIDTRYELFRADRRTRSLRSLLKLPETQPNPNSHGGNGIRVLPNGTIWLYNQHWGLLKADTTGRLLEHVASPLPIDRITAIQPMDHWIWLASEESGLYAYDLKTHQIVHHLHNQPTDSTSLLSNQVLGLVADPGHAALLWVGTQAGLSCLNTHTLRLQNWTEKQGLPSTSIQTLLADRQGYLWFSTTKGISRMDTRTGKMRHFSISDGLLDIEYRPNHAVELPDGRLAFGGPTGITVFDPQRLLESSQPIPTVLTGLKIDNRVMEPGQADSPLRLPLNAIQTLQLGPTQNFLSLEFAGLHYNKPTTLQYRYQLTGVNDDWVYVGNQNVANYTQLAPGAYEFRVNAADALGNWSHVVKTIRIIIAPPWWRTWWAYGLYGLLMIVLVRAYIQYRINQTQLQKEVALKEQEARLVQENADWQTRFFTNITHEFRTPLTLIINPLERLMETAAPALQQPLGVMHRNAQRLLRLINQLLDIAKLEAGQLTITQSQGNLPAFVAGLVDAFRPRADKKGVELTYESSGLTADYRFDAHKLESIGYNLLSNALKFTPSGGQIGVRLIEERSVDAPSGFQLQVSDTGVGIAPEQLNHIFDRFYQGRQVEGSLGTGTGIGLFLVAEFSRLLGGTVTVESQLGQGTRFTVTLPLEQADPAAPLVETIPAPPVLYAEEAPKPFVAPDTAPLVLLVEDNDELREFIAGQLVGTYRIITATNGQDGWEICLSELPELVISDVMMPIMDGFTLVERIKTTPLTAHMAVILLTAKTMTESRIQGLSVGANDYLTKPFNVQELQLRISNLLRHQQQLRQHWQQRMSQIDEGEHPTPLTPPPIADPFLDKLYQLLDKQVANPAFTIDQLADDLAVSPRTLRRKVATVTGSNAVELLRSYRLQKAATLLREGVSVSDAAEQTGFESVPYFSRSFKVQFAVSPSAYGPTRPRA
ncbi:hybrid sensor histidine kinase/response regulator transcription factor [Spirosoma aerolatum]|uniref:hybrid sensor histidine kinase/response regulator transcription factor n=1 Tax=Spirosoma aerolatum TaxID=1211326 RepID=UPI0009AC8B2D|nr:ATP-binding protein [Spirosoma aerolatum]